MKRGLFLILLIAFTYAQTDADDAQALLQSLYNDAKENLSDLKLNWEENGGLLSENVASWESTFNTQTDECAARDNDVTDTTNAQDENNNLIAWIGATNREKIAQYDKIFHDRCQAQRTYISGLKNDKIVMRLIEFLREAINNKETMNFIQKRQFAANLMKFIQLYQSKNTSQLLQLHASMTQNEDATTGDHVDEDNYEIDNAFDVNERTEEEIGTNQVDDNRERIDLEDFENGTRKPWAEYKKEILELLDNLETTLKNKMAQGQEDEVNAGIAAAEFRLRLEKEMQELDARLFIEVKKSSVIARRLKEVLAAQAACDIALEKVTAAYQESQDTYDAALQKFEDKEASINEEIEIFGYVLEQYKENMGGEAYREQLDDFTADGSYDDTYDEREIDSIDHINENGEEAGSVVAGDN